MGLDKPIYIQYLVCLQDVPQGDFGTSWRSHQSALSLIQRRFPATIWLTLVSIVIGLVISVPLGIVSSVRPYSGIAHCATFFSLVGITMPSFWLGLMLLLTLAVTLRWLPPSGYISPLVDPVMGLKFLLMPAVTLGIALAAPLTRFIRSGMLLDCDEC